MTKRNDLGRVRILCDADACERKFVPKRALVDIPETRRTAELYGWAWPTVDDKIVDLCPAHAGAADDSQKVAS
jgi:hypothetical protein